MYVDTSSQKLVIEGLVCNYFCIRRLLFTFTPENM